MSPSKTKKKRRKRLKTDFRTVVGFVVVGLLLVAALVWQSDTVKSYLLLGSGPGKDDQTDDEYCSENNVYKGDTLPDCEDIPAGPRPVVEGGICSGKDEVKCCEIVAEEPSKRKPSVITRERDCLIGLVCVQKPKENESYCVDECTAYQWRRQLRHNKLISCKNVDLIGGQRDQCGTVPCCDRSVEPEKVSTKSVKCDPKAVDTRRRRRLECLKKTAETTTCQVVKY